MEPPENCSLTDRELLVRYADLGDEGAFGMLVQRHLRVVLGLALRRLGCRQSGEEVALNVFTILSRKARRLLDHPALVAWLRQTAIFESAKAARRDRKHRLKMMAYEDHLEAGDAGRSVWDEAGEWLDSALLTLTESDCQLLHWHYVEGRTYREIGEMQGATEGASRVRAKRALKRLSHWFEVRGFRLAPAGLNSGLDQAAPSSIRVTSSITITSKEMTTHEDPQRPQVPAPDLKGVHADKIRNMIKEAQPFRPGASPAELVAEFANGEHRMAAFLALCDLGAAALPEVRRGLQNPNWQIRRWCAVVADNFADAETFQALLPLLNDSKSQVRVWAVHSLSCKQCKDGSSPIDAIPLLLQRIAEDESIKVRRQAVAMLSHHCEPDPRVTPVFRQVLEEEGDRKLRLHAEQGLKRYAKAGLCQF